MKHRHITVSTLFTLTNKVPQIRLSGKWLQKLGFHPGSKVSIHEESGRLTLQIHKREV